MIINENKKNQQRLKVTENFFVLTYFTIIPLLSRFESRKSKGIIVKWWDTRINLFFLIIKKSAEAKSNLKLFLSTMIINNQ